MASRKNGVIALMLSLSCALIATFTSNALATLTVDLRAVSTTSGSIISEKEVMFTGGAGDTITMDVIATISGMSNSEPTDDFIAYLIGSFLSSEGGLHGDLRARRVSGYGATLSGDGLQQDLDGDSDLDVGSNDDTTPAFFFRAVRSDLAPLSFQARVGSLTWTARGSFTDLTALNFRPRDAFDAALWWIDGHGYYASELPFIAGSPVTIVATPEPGPMLLLALLLIRTRGRKRCQDDLTRGGNSAVDCWR
jgi:hypothetical protein